MANIATGLQESLTFPFHLQIAVRRDPLRNWMSFAAVKALRRWKLRATIGTTRERLKGVKGA